MKFDDNTKVQAVKTYLSGGTLEKIALNFKIHRNTLWRWVKRYRDGGIEKLLRDRLSKKHWRRSPAMLEDKVVALKELTPSLTVRKAQNILKHEGIEISIKGIWNIWKRYGLSGFVKTRFSTSYQEYLSSPEFFSRMVQRIKQLIDEKKIEQAAKVVNDLPIFPQAEILKEIPEHLLSLRRQVDRLGTMFGAIPLSAYQKKAEVLRRELKREKMYYSALRAGIEEGYALMWLGKPGQLLKLTNELKTRAKGLRDPGLNFAFSLFEGHALGSFLKIKEALKCAKKCKVILKNLSNSYVLMGELSGLYSVLGHYREAIYWATEALKDTIGDHRKHICASLVGYLTTSGDHLLAIKILKEGKSEEWDYRSRALLCEAFISLNKGDFQEASSLALEALEQSKKEEIKRYFHLATFILACSHAASGEKKSATAILRKYNSLLKKYRLEKEYLLRKMKTYSNDINLIASKTNIPNNEIVSIIG
jgi:transposase